MAILKDLNCHGWSVVDLASLAHQAKLGIVVDIIRDHYKSELLWIRAECDCTTVDTILCLLS